MAKSLRMGRRSVPAGAHRFPYPPMTTQDFKSIHIVIITGLSGSGKSTASRALEDIGFFCVDNLPIALLPKLFELRSPSLGQESKIALVMDLREKDFLKTYPEIFAVLRRQGFQPEILFLEASDQALLRRFSQTRRTHPLAQQGGLLEAIRKEREMMKPLRSMAALVMDTSNYNIHQLQAAIRELFEERPPGRRMTVIFLSFGYSRGVPQEADLVIDVRFLPNPYFVEDLKSLPGTDARVHGFLFQFQETGDFFKRFQDFLAYLIPCYEKEGKSYLTVALGCTGGRHRSVAMAEKFRDIFQTQYSVRLRHRDLEEPPEKG